MISILIRHYFHSHRSLSLSLPPSPPNRSKNNRIPSNPIRLNRVSQSTASHRDSERWIRRFSPIDQFEASSIAQCVRPNHTPRPCVLCIETTVCVRVKSFCFEFNVSLSSQQHTVRSDPATRQSPVRESPFECPNRRTKSSPRVAQE